MSDNRKEGVFFNFCKRQVWILKKISFRLPRFVGGFFFKERIIRHYLWNYLKSKIYYENIMRYRCKHLGKNFLLLGEIPFMEGDGDIYIGDNVTMFGHVIMFTGGHIFKESEIRIGNNTTLGFGTQFRAAKQIVIGNNCMLGSGVRVNDNDGHPLGVQRVGGENPKVDPKDVKPVIIEDDVWVGEHSTILKGVTIGRGSIVSTGSVVAKSVPPMKIVMGNPARVISWVPGAEPAKDGEPGSDPKSQPESQAAD